MKTTRKIIALLMVIALCATFTGCMSQEEQLSAEAQALKTKIATLETQITSLEQEKTALEQTIIDKKIEGDTAKYVLTLNIKQVHYTLDITEHLKDSANNLSIQIPVDKEYYDSVEIGDTIDDSFRMGSFVFKGSFGSWDITVEDKEIL